MISGSRSSKVTDALGHSTLDSKIITTNEEIPIILAYCVMIWEGVRSMPQYRPHLILANYSGIPGLLAVILSRLYGTPVVVRLGGDPIQENSERLRMVVKNPTVASFFKYLLLYLTSHATLKWANGFIVVSENLKQRLLGNVGIRPELIKVVRPPIHVDEFLGSDGNQWRDRIDSELILLTVSNFGFHGKYLGVCEIIDGLIPILEQNPNVDYVIAGDGYYLPNLKQRVRRIVKNESLLSRIHFLGHVSDIENLYGAADVFIYSSYIDGYPNVILEAQCSGLAVVAAPNFGVEEQIQHCVDGCLVDISDSGELKDSIQRILSDPELRNRLATNASERVKSRNCPPVIGKDYEFALKSLKGKITG